MYIAQTGDVILGASALYALSLGMGVPLIILGTTGGKLLPKAGAWMDVIKNIFGFILLVVPVVLLQRLIPDIATDILWVILGLVFSTYLYVNNTNSNSKSGFWFPRFLLPLPQGSRFPELPEPVSFQGMSYFSKGLGTFGVRFNAVSLANLSYEESNKLIVSNI